MEMDIQELFKKKNKDILITNLKYDLDKNIGSLMETISNIFTLEFDTAITKMEAILSDSGIDNSKSSLTETINNMKLDSFKLLDKLINDKKNKVLKRIETLTFDLDNMNSYYELVLNTTKDLKDKLTEGILKVLEDNNNIIVEYPNIDELTNTRLEDYINERLYGKLETKIHMEIMLRDNNLINKAKEGYLRYQEICEKTMN